MDAWKAAGFDPRLQSLDKVTSVSAFEMRTGMMRSVTILDSGDERVVMPGLTDMRVLPDTSPMTAPVPIPETAHSYIATVADDTTSVSYNGTYTVPLRSDRAVEFYKVEMEKLGYKEDTKPDLRRIHGGASIDFIRGGEWVRIVATGPDKAKIEAAKRSGELPADTDGQTSFVTITHVRKLDQPETQR
jgi:hypothetical protein